MKPKPLSLLNHFTVPCVILFFFFQFSTGCQRTSLSTVSRIAPIAYPTAAECISEGHQRAAASTASPSLLRVYGGPKRGIQTTCRGGRGHPSTTTFPPPTS